MRRAVRILLRRPREAALYRILPDVIFELGILKGVSYSTISKAGLPDVSLGFQVLIELKREAAFHTLHCSLQSNSSGRQDQVKMVRHHHKLMQQILLLLPVTEHVFYEQSRNFLNLEQVSPRLHICGDKVCGLACFPSMRNCQKS